MTFQSLFATVRDAVATGKIGTPVSLRLHADFPDASMDLGAVVDTIMTETGPLFPAARWTVMAKRNASGRQLTALLQNDAGRTVFVTLNCGGTRAARLSLLVIGNHGVLRLEGGDEIDGSFVESAPDASWRSAIEATIAQKVAVVV